MELDTNDTFHVLDSFLSDFSFDFFRFLCRTEEKLNLVISPPDDAKWNYVTFLSSIGSITSFEALLLDKI